MSKKAVQLCAPVFAFLVLTVPLLVVAVLLPAVDGTLPRLALLCAAPITGPLWFVLVAGLLSRTVRRGVVAGKFPRSLAHAVHGPRRLHGLCWTLVCYSGPLDHLILPIAALRDLTLRLFGYRGSLDTTFLSGHVDP